MGPISERKRSEKKYPFHQKRLEMNEQAARTKMERTRNLKWRIYLNHRMVGTEKCDRYKRELALWKK